ncbi:uncharacterized protein BcabD6B2_38020 [Babesia caballi]|uniref:Uncharacterized protein n=1 Tax=Babesia caballi TaxID=5871 RepID=A0AAV4LX25_BABCB|nr:hypothetical protein, conserved [Babesia caballi]
MRLARRVPSVVQTLNTLRNTRCNDAPTTSTTVPGDAFHGAAAMLVEATQSNSSNPVLIKAKHLCARYKAARRRRPIASVTLDSVAASRPSLIQHALHKHPVPSTWRHSNDPRLTAVQNEAEGRHSDIRYDVGDKGAEEAVQPARFEDEPDFGPPDGRHANPREVERRPLGPVGAGEERDELGGAQDAVEPRDHKGVREVQEERVEEEQNADGSSDDAQTEQREA